MHRHTEARQEESSGIAVALLEDMRRFATKISGISIVFGHLQRALHRLSTEIARFLHCTNPYNAGTLIGTGTGRRVHTPPAHAARTRIEKFNITFIVGPHPQHAPAPASKLKYFQLSNLHTFNLHADACCGCGCGWGCGCVLRVRAKYELAFKARN